MHNHPSSPWESWTIEKDGKTMRHRDNPATRGALLASGGARVLPVAHTRMHSSLPPEGMSLLSPPLVGSPFPRDSVLGSSPHLPSPSPLCWLLGQVSGLMYQAQSACTSASIHVLPRAPASPLEGELSDTRGRDCSHSLSRL